METDVDLYIKSDYFGRVKILDKYQEDEELFFKFLDILEIKLRDGKKYAFLGKTAPIFYLAKRNPSLKKLIIDYLNLTTPIPYRKNA